MAKRFELLTPAKINLFLRITGRRPDGYHELDSLFLPVSIFDRIVVEVTAAAESSVSLRCNWPEMPLDGRNLAVRAAERMMAATGLRMRVAIDLHKEIPAGAGLGGGSSDAGAVLRALAELNGIDAARLAAVALEIGADVPFFLDPRPARISGVGEHIEYLDGEVALDLVIAVPPLVVPTAEIYRYLMPRHWSGRGPGHLPAPLSAGQITPELLVNDLETVAVARYPQIAKVKFLLQDLGAAGTVMSGSGGAVLGVFHSPAEAVEGARAGAAAMPQARFFAVRVLQGGAL
jgi:4-diphosphocytidyl-2-C-methyl-D-erythritol kinase